MNWGLFLFVSLVTIVAGLLSRRGGVTPLEAWTLVLTRVALGLVFGAYVPEQINSPAYVLLAGVELARLTEHIIAYTADKTSAKMEARTWLNRSKYRAT